MFCSKNKKKYLYPCIPQFCYLKVGIRGYTIYRHVIMIVWRGFEHRTGLICFLKNNNNILHKFVLNPKSSFQDVEAVRFLQELSEEVCQRLKNIHMKGRSVTLKLMVRREDAPTETAKFLGMIII